MLRRSTTVLSLLASIAGCGGDGGDVERRIIEDVTWVALVDGDDPGALSHDDEPQTVRLSDFSAAGRPDTELILIVVAAGWCVPCQGEASALGDFAADYPEVAVLTTLFEDDQSNPADVEFARAWAETFSLTIPTIVDASFELGRYIDVNSMPTSILVDAHSMEILAVTIGADSGADPLASHRSLVD